MCSRSKVVIPGLLRKIRELELQIEEMELRTRDVNEKPSHEPKEKKNWKIWWVIAKCVAYAIVFGQKNY